MDTRGEQIADVFKKYFHHYGFKKTSVDEVAAELHISKKTIYSYFESKEAIFAELIIDRHPFQQILPIVLNTPTDDIEKFVRTAARTMVSELGKRPDFI